MGEYIDLIVLVQILQGVTSPCFRGSCLLFLLCIRRGVGSGSGFGSDVGCCGCSSRCCSSVARSLVLLVAKDPDLRADRGSFLVVGSLVVEDPEVEEESASFAGAVAAGCNAPAVARVEVGEVAIVRKGEHLGRCRVEEGAGSWG